MYANNTTTEHKSIRIFKASNGVKFVLPGSFPSTEERAAIARLWKESGLKTARGVFASYVQDLTTGLIPGLDEELDQWEQDNAERAAELRAICWTTLEAGFEAEYNRTWQEDLALAMEEDTVEGITEDNAALIRSLRFEADGITHRQYNTDKEETSDLTYGAASSRRCQVPMRVWVARVRKNHHEALVGVIAQRVWAMPVRELRR